MEMPNSGSLEIGKADQVRELPLPEWAMNAASLSNPPRVMNPLNMHAGSRMMGQGTRKVLGKKVWPWQRKKVDQGALEIAQGRTFVYSPVGSGRSYT